jgi:hypothetical protein
MSKTLIGLIGLLLIARGMTSLSAQEVRQKAPLISFERALERIEDVYKYRFTYASDLVKNQEKVFLNTEGLSIDQALQVLFKNKEVKYSIKGNHIVLSANKSPKKHTISGLILEEGSGETLIGATIYSKEKHVATLSNQFGFYSLSLEEGEYLLMASYIGYSTFSKVIDLDSDLYMDITMSIESKSLKEVVINGRVMDTNVTETSMSKESLEIETIKSMPALMGEVDVLKSLQMLPGVQSSGDGTANLNVRGGSYDQNLILLDDAPIYNPTHALGFFSVFNADAIKSVEIYKGGLPAQYGDRLSSVIDIRMKEGNLNQVEGTASLGLIASKLSLEGPIKKGRSSFIVSGRYSYAGKVADGYAFIAQEFGGLNDYGGGSELNFHDLNLKVNYKLNDRNRFYVSAYTGRDNFHFKIIDEKSKTNWGNIASTFRWNHIFNQRLFSNTTLAFSNYDYSYTIKNDFRDFEWASDLQELNLKNDFDFYANPKNHVKFGLSVNYHRINPGAITPRSAESVTKAAKLENNYGIESSLYISNIHEMSEELSIEYGLRLSSFVRLGKGVVYKYATKNKEQVIDSTIYTSKDIQKIYAGLEPRLNIRYQLNPTSSLKTSYSRTRQYMHLVSPSSVGLPTDVWHTVGEHIRPQISDQFAFGYFRNFKKNIYESSIEVYYKDMQNQIDLKDNANLFLNPHIEQEVKNGIGWAYGIEFLLRKKVGKLTGWLSYTRSKTERQIKGINGGKAYPTRFDKRNDISMTLSYPISKRLSLSGNFAYSTGAGITVPVGSFIFQGIAVNKFSERNSYRLPDYHRADLSLVLKSKKKRAWDGQWVFSIYNVYNRHNAFSVFAKADSYDISSSEGHLMYMFGAVPSISYTIKF